MVLTSEEHAEDLDKSVFPGMQGGPLMHNVAGKAVGFWGGPTARVSRVRCTDGDEREGRRRRVERRRHSSRLRRHGQAPRFVDLRESHPDLTGEEAEAALESVGITVNKNTVLARRGPRSSRAGYGSGRPHSPRAGSTRMRRRGSPSTSSTGWIIRTTTRSQTGSARTWTGSVNGIRSTAIDRLSDRPSMAVGLTSIPPFVPT